jgi:hypothetical protein
MFPRRQQVSPPPRECSGTNDGPCDRAQALGHLKTSEVGEVLERAVRRMEKHLRRRGLLVDESGADGAEDDADPESNLAASAVSGRSSDVPAVPAGNRGGETPRQASPRRPRGGMLPR